MLGTHKYNVIVNSSMLFVYVILNDILHFTMIAWRELSIVALKHERHMPQILKQYYIQCLLFP